MNKSKWVGVFGLAVVVSSILHMIWVENIQVTLTLLVVGVIIIFIGFIIDMAN